jgi:hypothetical protein
MCVERGVAYVCPFCSPGLYGVLKSGGLLAGSAFTLDKDGVSNFFLVPALFVDPTLGVLGTRPSSLITHQLSKMI